MTTAQDFICFRANTTTPANRQGLPAYDWKTTTATKTICRLGEGSEMDLDGPPPSRVAAGTLGRLGSNDSGSCSRDRCIDSIDQNNNPRDHWRQNNHGDQPLIDNDGVTGIAISTTGFTTINKTEEKQDSAYSIAVPERARRCRSMDRNLTHQHDDPPPPPLRALHPSPPHQAAEASSSSLLLSDSSMDHPDDDEEEEFIQAIGRRKPYPHPPPLPPPLPNHLLRSAASWDELDASSSKKRSSTRKHAHFASHHHNRNGDDLHEDSEDNDPTSSLSAARQHSSSCKKPRGTPIRKSIFTPIKKREATAAVKAQGDDNDDEQEDDDNLLLDNDPQHDHHLPWEISAATTTPACVLPAKTTGNKPNNKKLNKRSFGTVTTTATSSTSATTHFGDESTDHSVDSTGTTSNFRFTSFPASLPRIHQPPYHQQHQHHYHNHHHPASAAATVLVPTNISNLHGSYTMMESDCVVDHHNINHQHNTNNNDYHAYCYSGDDHTAADDSSTVASSMYGTPVARLTFASAIERAGAPAPCCTSCRCDVLLCLWPLR
jgi:hypothetical protein